MVRSKSIFNWTVDDMYCIGIILNKTLGVHIFSAMTALSENICCASVTGEIKSWRGGDLVQYIFPSSKLSIITFYAFR